VKREPIDSRWYVLLVNKARFKDVRLLRGGSRLTLRLDLAASFEDEAGARDHVAWALSPKSFVRGVPPVIPAGYRPFVQQIDRYACKARVKPRKVSTAFGTLKLQPDETLLPCMGEVQEL
jgi:hypothetical protein